MAKLDCQFFPGSPATWVCSSCHTAYSDKCIPAGKSRHWGRRPPSCIRCNGALQYLGSATGAKPFWQMLPHFFRYPLQGGSALLIVLLAAASLLLGGAGLLSLLLAIFALAVVVKYGFAIIEHRGLGETRPPSVSAVLTGDEHHLFIKQIAVMVLMGVAIGVAGHLNPMLGLLVAAFMTLAMPASVMVLAVDKSVGRALNPLVLLALMTAVGWPYLLLWVCVQIVSAGPFYILSALIAVVPEFLIGPLLVGLMVYFTLVLYAMLGYVLFEYQSELGFETAVEREELDRPAFEKARALGEAAVLIKDGEYTRARESLRKALDMVRDDVELHQRYHKLLMLLDDDEALVNHGEYLIDLYHRQKQLAKAAAVVVDLHSRVPGFQLPSTQLALELVPVLQMQKQYKSAVRLFMGLHKTRPQDPLLPDAYSLLAKILFEHLNEDTKALAVIEFLLKKHPNCAQRGSLEKLRETIKGGA